MSRLMIRTAVKEDPRIWLRIFSLKGHYHGLWSHGVVTTGNFPRNKNIGFLAGQITYFIHIRFKYKP